MEADAGGEIQDWEVLHSTNNSSSDEANSVTDSDSVEITMTRVLDEGLDADVDGGSQGTIKLDYFSLDSATKYVSNKEEGSVESDSPSWIDPEPDSTRCVANESGEFWADSGSDRSEDHKFSEFDGKLELGFDGNAEKELGFEGIGEIVAGGEDSGRFWSDSGGIVPNSMEFGGLEQNIDVGSGGIANSIEKSDNLAEESMGDVDSGGKESVAIGAVNKSGEEGEKRSVVWWKVPFEFLKLCAFRVSGPVWTLSVAAAVMGFVLLGRRLYRMKRKSQSLQLKVTMDDKKVSQFMTRAARLNEAFSVVKRVPVIRPALPAAGVTPWPVMSLR